MKDEVRNECVTGARASALHVFDEASEPRARDADVPKIAAVFERFVEGYAEHSSAEATLLEYVRTSAPQMAS